MQPSKNTSPITSIGLMSGTSLDGIDAAIIHSDGETITARGASHSLPYGPACQQRIRDVIAGVGDAEALAEELTHLHNQAVHQLLAKAHLTAGDIGVIGFHGQTVDHRPDEGITLQLGDGALLAALTGIDVVFDFRIADVSLGGQGAPLVPIYHQALFADVPKPLAIVNIGGVANVTYIGEEGQLLGFDTGPGNALINDWVQAKTGEPYDKNGDYACAGQVDTAIVDAVLSHGYFALTPPKSLDRNTFDATLRACETLSLEDGAATLSQCTIGAIAQATRYFPTPTQWIICGGGRHNEFLMQGLAAAVAGEVVDIDVFNLNGDMIEAEAFTFLAVRSLRRLPLTFPGTTGVSQPATGGVFYPAKARADSSAL